MLRCLSLPVLGRLGVAAGVAGLTLTVGACADSATAPVSARPTVTRPSNSLQLTSYVKVHLVDIHGNPLPEKAWIRIRSVPAKDSVDVQDQYDIKDLDPAQGSFKVAMPPAAGFEACVVKFTNHFSPDTTGGLPSCKSAVSGTKSTLTIDVGTIVMRRRPMVTFVMQDIFGQTIPGGTVVLQQGSMWGPFVIQDGQLYADESPPLDGKIAISLYVPGTWNYCEKYAPAGYNVSASSCATPYNSPSRILQTSWEGIQTVVLKHTKLIYQ